jgi:tetratricopeptide (TPR) repeat protein
MRAHAGFLIFTLIAASVLCGCKTESKLLPPSLVPEGATVEKVDPTAAAEHKRSPKAVTCFTAGQCAETRGDTLQGMERQKEFDLALGYYQQALELDPKFTMATIRIARIHEKNRQLPRAFTVYQEALKANEKDAGLWCELGMLHGRQKQFDKSIECLQKAVQLEPTNQTYSNNLGWSLARAGKFDQSLEHFTRSLGAARAHYNLARMARHLGKEDVCQQHLNAALQADPQFSDARQMMNGADPGVMQAEHTAAPQ